MQDLVAALGRVRRRHRGDVALRLGPQSRIEALEPPRLLGEGVEGHRHHRPDRGPQARRVEGLALLRHRAHGVHDQRQVVADPLAQAPEAARIEDARHRAVAQAAREGLGPLAAAGDVERHLAGALGAGHGHGRDRALAVGVVALLAGEQAPQVEDLALEPRQAHRPDAQGEAAGEAGAHRGPHASRRERRQGAQGRRRGGRSSQARHHDPDPQPDPRRAIGRPGERGERVVVEQRRVVAPDGGEAELLRQGDVVGACPEREPGRPRSAAARSAGHRRVEGGRRGDRRARASPGAACATPPPRRPAGRRPPPGAPCESRRPRGRAPTGPPGRGRDPGRWTGRRAGSRRGGRRPGRRRCSG